MDIKVDALNEKIDSSFRTLDQKIDSKCDSLRESLTTLRLELKDEFAAIRKQQWLDKVWWLMIAAAILGVMARGMKWI